MVKNGQNRQKWSNSSKMVKIAKNGQMYEKKTSDQNVQDLSSMLKMFGWIHFAI